MSKVKSIEKIEREDTIIDGVDILDKVESELLTLSHLIGEGPKTIPLDGIAYLLRDIRNEINKANTVIQKHYKLLTKAG